MNLLLKELRKPKLVLFFWLFVCSDTLYTIMKVGPVAGDMAAERKRNLEILSSMTKRKAILDAEKAAKRHVAQEQRRSDSNALYIPEV